MSASVCHGNNEGPLFYLAKNIFSVNLKFLQFTINQNFDSTDVQDQLGF